MRPSAREFEEMCEKSATWCVDPTGEDGVAVPLRATDSRLKRYLIRGLSADGRGGGGRGLDPLHPRDDLVVDLLPLVLRLHQSPRGTGRSGIAMIG